MKATNEELLKEITDLKTKVVELEARPSRKVRENRKFRRTDKTIMAEHRLAPQQVCLLQGLAHSGDKYVDIIEWGKLAVEHGGMIHRQKGGPEAVANYYVNYAPKPLLGLGYIEQEPVKQ